MTSYNREACYKTTCFENDANPAFRGGEGRPHYHAAEGNDAIVRVSPLDEAKAKADAARELCNRSLNALRLEVAPEIVKDVKRIVEDAIETAYLAGHWQGMEDVS